MRPPSCERDPSECRITPGASYTTGASWHPLYDGNGDRIGGGDTSTVITVMTCETCFKTWNRRMTALGVMTIEEHAPAGASDG